MRGKVYIGEFCVCRLVIVAWRSWVFVDISNAGRKMRLKKMLRLSTRESSFAKERLLLIHEINPLAL